MPFPSPGDLPDPGIEPRSPRLQVDVLTSEPPGKLETLEMRLIAWMIDLGKKFNKHVSLLPSQKV